MHIQQFEVIRVRPVAMETQHLLLTYGTNDNIKLIQLSLRFVSFPVCCSVLTICTALLTHATCIHYFLLSRFEIYSSVSIFKQRFETEKRKQQNALQEVSKCLSD